MSVLVLFLFTIVAGFLGFQRYLAQHGESFNWVRSIYRTIQLFSTEGGDLQEPIPWVLHLVRFTAPMTAIIAFLLAIIEIFSEQWKRMRISGMKNHVVIIGLGTKGKNVMAENLLLRERVLVIEKDPMNPDLDSLHYPSCRLIIGNATNLEILKKARIKRAKRVYLLTGDDSQQVKACLLIYDLIKKSKRNKENPLECIMHLLNKDSLNILRTHNIIQNIDDGLSLNVFNVYENSARELFQDHPPDRSGLSEPSKEFVQMIIFGFGQAGETLALQCALTGHYLNFRRRIPKVVVFDRLAEEKVQDFKKRYPTCTAYCELVPKPIEADSPQLITELTSFLNIPDSLNTIVLCFDNSTNNMLLGLQIQSITLLHSRIPFQVFSRTDDNEAFTSITSSIKPYGLPSHVCSQSAIHGGELDDMAKANHAFFLDIRKTEPDFGSRAADVPWEELSQEFRDSNRKVADHIGVKVRGTGCQIVPEDDPRKECTMTKTEVDLLSELEHRRWNAERSLAGWTYSPARNDKTRQTPYLVEWSDLPPDIQKYDRDSVENIPNVLKVARLKIIRNPVK
jgi:voltage-gated potassium channel Kch